MDFLKKLIELNFKSDNEDKIKISPIGEVEGLDGRAFDIDANSVIKNTKNNKIDLVVDVNHGWSEYGEKAGGWITLNSLEVRDDGIYASINWTDIGKELLEKKYYKYLSPAYMIDKHRNVLSLDSVGIVNRPNLLNEKLVNSKNNNKENNKMDDKMDDDLKKQIRDLKKKLEDKYSEVEKLLEKIKKSKIDNAISRAELSPNKKDFALNLDDKSLDEFLEMNKADLTHLNKDVNQKQDETKTISSEEKEVNKQLGLQEETK